MLYDAALIHCFRVLINSKSYRWYAQTRVGIWLTEKLSGWIECAANRINSRKSASTHQLVEKMIELETHVQQMRQELTQLKKTVKKR
jgi:hypothetical protein